MEHNETKLNKKRGSAWRRGFFWGGMIGAIGALLMAPRSGGETRTLVRERSQELKDKASITMDRTKFQAEEIAQMGAEKVAYVTNRGKNILNKQAGRVQGVIEGIKEGTRAYKEESN
jgi:gas vesicle protein